jgi:glycosyltransferase involved in cell wall biosynthesis
MITFAPSLAKLLLPRVPFVTRFENVYGAHPPRTSFFARVIRKGLAYWLSADYGFGTLLDDSDRIILLSDRHRDRLPELSPALQRKSVLIPPPPNMRICPDDDGAVRRSVRKALGVTSTDFVLAYIGYMYPGKGVETLLKAFHIVSQRRRDIRLILLGGVIALEFPGRPSYMEQLHSLAKELGIDDKVSWTGEYTWDSDEASAYLRGADICALPFDEGVQLNHSSFSSAAAHGLPIITTRGPSLEQPFIHGENVFLCPPRSPEALAAAITTLMDTHELRQSLRGGVLTLAQEWFSWQRGIDRTIETLVGFSPGCSPLDRP